MAKQERPRTRREKGKADPSVPALADEADAAGQAAGDGPATDDIEFDDIVDQGEGLQLDLENEDDIDLTSEDVDEETADAGERESAEEESAEEEDEPSLDSEDDSLVDDPFTPGEGDSGWTSTGRFRALDPGTVESLDPDPDTGVPFDDLRDDSFDDFGDPDVPLPPAPEPERPLPPMDAQFERPDGPGQDKATDTLSIDGGAIPVEDDPLRSEANRLLLQGKLDEALTTISTLRKMQPDDEPLDQQYEELLTKVISTYFPGETPDSMPRLTVSLAEITELVTDPLMGQLLCRMDGKTPLRFLDSALPDLAPGSLYQLLSRAKGMGLVRMD